MSIKDSLKKVNPKIPPIVVMVASLLIAALFVYYAYLPMTEEKVQAEEELAVLQQKVDDGRIKVRKLDELTKANAKLDQDLTEARKVLPTNEELTALLETIGNLVKESGLNLGDWKREKSVTDKSALYTETVIGYEVSGSYHDLGKFMEKLDGQARLVTVTNLGMSSAKLSGYKMDIPIKFTLIAYSAGGGN